MLYWLAISRVWCAISSYICGLCFCAPQSTAAGEKPQGLVCKMVLLKLQFPRSFNNRHPIPLSLQQHCVNVCSPVFLACIYGRLVTMAPFRRQINCGGALLTTLNGYHVYFGWTKPLSDVWHPQVAECGPTVLQSHICAGYGTTILYATDLYSDWFLSVEWISFRPVFVVFNCFCGKQGWGKKNDTSSKRAGYTRE